MSHLGEVQEKNTFVYCDNNTSIKLFENHAMHGRFKHIDTRYHFLRYSTKGVIELVKCSLPDQVDMLTL